MDCSSAIEEQLTAIRERLDRIEQVNGALRSGEDRSPSESSLAHSALHSQGEEVTAAREATSLSATARNRARKFRRRRTRDKYCVQRELILQLRPRVELPQPTWPKTPVSLLSSLPLVNPPGLEYDAHGFNAFWYSSLVDQCDLAEDEAIDTSNSWNILAKEFKPSSEPVARPSGDILAASYCAVQVGDFRSLPSIAWERLNSLFNVRTAPDTEPGDQNCVFTQIEVILILKDFLIAIDNIMDSYGIDITEQTASIRRKVEESYMSDSEPADHDVASPVQVENVLRQFLSPVLEWVSHEHEMNVHASDIDVAGWLAYRRFQLQPATASGATSSTAEVSSVTAAAPQADMRMATAAWIGLKVSRRDNSVASSSSSSVNRHGGSSSTTSSKKRRAKPPSLPKASDGKHRHV